MTGKRNKVDVEKDDNLTLDWVEILKDVKPMGRYQVFIVLTMNLVTTIAGIAVTIYVFTGYRPFHRCVIPQCEEVRSGSYFDGSIGHLTNKSYSEYVQLGIGLVNKDKRIDQIGCQRAEAEDLASPTVEESGCQSYMKSLISNNESLTVKKCGPDDLIFDKSVVLSSFITQYDLLCDKFYLVGFFNAFYMVGMLIGSFFIGLISDRWGRNVAMVISICIVSVSGTLTAVIDNVYMFALLRITVGIGGMGCFMIPYIITAENTTKRHTVTLTSLSSLGFPLGQLILAAFAYQFRNHIHLQAILHAPIIILVFLALVVPESPRWLIAKGYNSRAREAIKKVEKISGNSVSEAAMKGHPRVSGLEVDSTHDQNLTIKDLFSNRTLAFRTLGLFWCWMSATVTFYGLLFASTSLAGNPYLNFVLNAVMEFPAIIVMIFFTDYFGRRKMGIAVQLSSGICCLVAGNLVVVGDSVWALRTFFSLVGKFSGSMAFGVVYLYTAELYPTSLRGTAVGCCSTFARCGGIFALSIAGLSRIWEPLPMTIFGIIGIVAGCIGFMFPETTGVSLPETMEEAINIGRKKQSQ